MEVGRATLGVYRLLEEIGRGGVGSVYLAEHTLLRRRAAIKVLQSSVSANQEIVTRFFNEARAVTRIADPGIVQITPPVSRACCSAPAMARSSQGRFGHRHGAARHRRR